MEILYHGSDYLFNKFKFVNVGKKSGTGGAGFGIYLTNTKSDAMCYGKYLYTVQAELGRELNNNKKTLNRQQVKQILTKFEELSENSYCEAYGENASIDYVVTQLINNNQSDTDIINDIINATDSALVMVQVLSSYGWTHAIDTTTPVDKTITNYVVYDLSKLKIISREKPLNEDIEEIIKDTAQTLDVLNETMMYMVGENIPESLVNLPQQMSKSEKTKTLTQAQGRAKSKSQRRLMAMALAYKRGKLPAKYASDTIKKLASDIDQQTLHDFAKTNQKRRRKDGSVGKRNNIPQYVKGSKYNK